MDAFVSGEKNNYPASGNGQTAVFTRRSVSNNLTKEIFSAMKNVGAFGSIEIFIQDHHVTQITARSIKKTKHALSQGNA